MDKPHIVDSTVVVLASLFCLGVSVAFPQVPGVPAPGVPAPDTPPQDTQQQEDDQQQEDADTLIIDDFEENVSARWVAHLVPETEHVKRGEQAGRWTLAAVADEARLADVPSDWTGYTLLEFWTWSAVANDAEIVLNAYTDNQLTDGADFFQRRIRVNWEGWKQFKLPLDSFSIGLQPTMERIDAIAIANAGWGIEPKDDTELVFDEIVLTRGEARQLPEGYLADFEGDVSWISGLDIVEIDDRRCGRWYAHRYVATRPFEDWSDYDFIEMDIHSKVANGDQFLMRIQSENAETDGPDYWSVMFYVDWTGWRHFKFRLKHLRPARKPLGWNMITGFRFFDRGWGMAQKTDTELCFDDIKLTKMGDDTSPSPPKRQ